MSADAVSVAQRFAHLRAAFHRLLDADPAVREHELRRIEVDDPAVGGELRNLLESMDETDLLALSRPTPPRQLGPFKLLQRIGRGGMGDVFLAERVEGGFEQRVALKLVRESAASPDTDRRFQRERRILARLMHPNIAHLIDGGVAPDGRPWLAMEYVAGERIVAWCEARALDRAARVRLFLPVCDAVAFAHRNLIVHRDLKPANLMVDGEGRPRLLDFGIARLLDDSQVDPIHTLTAMTPAYAAPEQRSGAQITTATDVYQLGVVLQELLGVRAAPGQAQPARVALRGDLARVLAKATAETPGDRYASVAMLADDLRDWLEHRPLRSGIGSRRERLRKTLWQWRWGLGATLAVLAALALGGGVALRQTWRAQQEEAISDANFRGMLDVLGALQPRDYRGADPPLSEALNAAAQRLQREYADQPALLWRALGTIARTFVNRHRTDLALPLLQATEAALARDPRATPAQRFDFAVMHFGAASPGAAERDAMLARVRALAEQVEPERAVAEIWTTALGLAMYGRVDAADALSALVLDRLDDPHLRAETAWWYWYVRSEIAWRQDDVVALGPALAQLRALDHTRAPRLDAAQRRQQQVREAEHALLLGDTAGAAWALARIDGTLLDPDDAAPELALVQARLQLQQGDAAVAAAATRALLVRLDAAPGTRHVGGERREAAWLLVAAELERGDCAAARRALDVAREHSSSRSAQVPRNLRLGRVAQQQFEHRCDAGAAAVDPDAASAAPPGSG
jgi:tRNA A-37 threonylcarbamoyl transferase component Bud32